MTSISETLIKTPVKYNVPIDGRSYTVVLMSPKDHKASVISEIQQSLAFFTTEIKKLGLNPQDVRILKGGIYQKDAEGRFTKVVTPTETDKKIAKLWDKIEKGEVKPIKVATQEIIERQHKSARPYIEEVPHANQTIQAEYSFVKKESPLDLIYDAPEAGARNHRKEGESEASYIRRCARELIEGQGKTYNAAKKKIQETIIGISNSIIERKDYKVSISYPDKNTKELRKYSSQECWARNGFTKGSITSSFNRFADRVTLLRALKNEKGEIDCISGRVSTEKTAREMAEFAFLSHYYSEMKPEPNKDGSYTFTFAVQSLLPMNFFEKSSRQMNLDEIKAYKDLKDNGVIEITLPDTEKKVQVQFNPLPLAVSQFNYWKTAEELLPAGLSGKAAAREQSKQCDAVLIQLGEAKLAELEKNPENQGLAKTIEYLKNPEALEAHEELMVRAYLCKLLNIPLVTHCKSSVDRTNVLNALIVSMNMMMRMGEFKLAENGFKIFAMAEQPLFKELFAIHLIKGEKTAEFSRNEEGYKYLFSLAQHPSLQKLLPADLLTKNELISKKTVLKCAVVAILSISLLISLLLDLSYRLPKSIISHGLTGDQSDVMKSRHILKLCKKIWEWKEINESKGMLPTRHQLLHKKDRLPKQKKSRTDQPAKRTGEF